MNRKDIGLFMMMGDVNWKWKGEWEKKGRDEKNCMLVAHDEH